MMRIFFTSLSVMLFIGFTGCAENPRLQFLEQKDKATVVQFKLGVFVDKVDLDKVMKDYCGSLTPRIIQETEVQLPGQYKFQKRVEFVCVSP